MGHRQQRDCSSRIRTAALLAVIAMQSAGCAFLMPDKIHYELTPGKASAERCETPAPADSSARIVGIALSGGGSRAAVFGAAALEALAEHGLLSQASHISSVSGGSLASSYYMANPPTCGTAIDSAGVQSCWRDYFGEFKTRMRTSYRNWLLLRNLKPTRFSSPTRRVISLQEALDNEFLGNSTFGELHPEPVLLINATSYDERRRFVFSNVCLEEGAGDAATVAHDGTTERYRIMAAAALSERTLQAFTFSRPDCARPVPADFPLLLAVAASAAFPPALGPVAIQAPSSCGGGDPEWWHLGDGGAIENAGTDSLEEVILRRLVDATATFESALILSVDAGKALDPEELKSERNFRMYSNPERVNLVVEAPRQRGQSYHDVFWDELSGEMRDAGIGYEKFTFLYSQSPVAELPASCRPRTMKLAEIHERLESIATDFVIDDCSADLLEIAAHRLVHETFDDAAVRRLEEQGYSVAPGDHVSGYCAIL